MKDEAFLSEVGVSAGQLANDIFAVVDTACSKILVGTNTFEKIRKFLRDNHQMDARVYAANHVFKGIGGRSYSKRLALIPIGIGGRFGILRACVLGGNEAADRSPLLLSLRVLRGLKAQIDCDNSRMTLETLGVTVPLTIRDSGHLLLNVYEYSSDKKKRCLITPWPFYAPDCQAGTWRSSGLLREHACGRWLCKRV